MATHTPLQEDFENPGHGSLSKIAQSENDFLKCVWNEILQTFVKTTMHVMMGWTVPQHKQEGVIIIFFSAAQNTL